MKLKPLVFMQLKDKIDLSFMKNKKDAIIKLVLLICGVAVITAAIYLLMQLAVKLSIFSIVNILPISVIVVVFTVMFISSMLVCTFQLTKTLYFSKDNLVLLTMPVKPSVVFFSKLVVFYLYELYKSLFFIFPLFLAYGLISQFSFLYFIWFPFCLLFVAALPVLIGALLSIPFMLITVLFKKYKIISVVFFSALIGLFIWLVVFIIGNIPANLNLIERWGVWFWEIQDFLNNFVKWFSPITAIVSMVCGKFVYLNHKLFSLSTLYTLLIVIGIIGVVITLCYLLSQPLFFKMASKPFEYDKKNNLKAKLNIKRNKYVSILKKDGLVLFSSSDGAYSLFSVTILLPILILLFNKIVSAMNTRLLGQYLALTFNLVIILIIVLSANIAMSSIYSKEANASFMLKTMPLNYAKALIIKLVYHFVFITASIITSVVIVAKFNNLNPLNAALFGFAIIFVYAAHLLWSAELDIMNPQNRLYQHSGAVEANPNERVSGVLAYLLSFVLAVVFMFLLNESVVGAIVKLFVIGLVFLLIRIFFYAKRVKIYYSRS